MHELISNHRQLHKIAKIYLAIQFCQALYFAWPVFYGFASLALSPLQVGIYFSVYNIMKVLAEVPTDAFADRYGRKLSAMVGALTVIAVPLIMYFGHNFPAYLACALLLAIGNAFMSGSIEAMVYDHPKVSKENFRHVVWLEITFFQVGLITSAAVGGFLYAAHPSLPFFGEALAWTTAFLLILMLPNSKPTDSDRAAESYGRYFKTGLRHLLASKYLRIVVLSGVLVAVIMTACIEFVNEATMISYGLEPSQRGLLIAGVKVLALIVINLILLKLLRKDRARLLFIGMAGTAIFALLSIEALAAFFIGFVLFNWLSATQYSFFKPMIHDHLPSSHRATAISGFSALTGFVAFGGNALFGALIEYFKTPRAVYMVSAGIFIVIVVPCIVWLAAHLKQEEAPAA